MRKYVLLAIVGVVLSSGLCFADDMTYVNPVSNWADVTVEHQDADPWKGWATITLTNTMSEDWGGFQFNISATSGAETVFFADSDGIDTTAMLDGSNPYAGASYELSNNGISGPTTLTFEFFSNPVETGEVVTFMVYTDNTTTPNNTWFNLCMTPLPVPEPMTVAILGIGGLLLVRKKQ